MVMEVTETEHRCVVTGGRGFAARHLVEMLVRHEMFHVRIADLAPAIQLEAHEETGLLGEAMRSGRVHYVSADLRDKAQVIKSFQGAEVVFHMAAPDSSINNYKLHYSVNVQGTTNVIDACVEVGVKRLIYTSSPSVVFDGVNSILNANETMPYPSNHNDSYSATKAKGEALVIEANGRNGLLTCCIRPSSIFGPGDRLLVPSLVAAARAGKSKFIIGDGSNFYDFTYVENVVHAHICAERALASGGEVCAKAAGQAYFITNMEPIKFWEFMSLLLEGLGYDRPSIKIPAIIMMPIAHLVELVYKLLGPYGMKVPQLTPSRVRLLSCSRTFDSSKAKELLGYAPVVPLQEGIKRTIDSFTHLTLQNQPKKEVNDRIQWKKQIVIAIVILITLYLNFVATTGYSAVLIPVLVASMIFFFRGIFPEKMKLLGSKKRIDGEATMVNSYAPLRFTIFISFSLAAATSFKLSASHSPSSLPKATAGDLLTVLGPPSSAAYTVNPAVSRELRSCLRFLVPFQPRKPIPEPGRCSLRTGLCSGRRRRFEEEEDENSLVWWPPESVLEIARLAVDSGGDPGSIHRALDPTMIPVPPTNVEGSRTSKCQLTRTPYGRHFIAEEVNSYFEFLFRLIESRGPSVGLNVSLSRYDLFHGHLFLASESGRLGILFHAKEYPAYDKRLFPYNMGYCQRGSDVKYGDSINLRNILWLAPLPSKSGPGWLAPGVLVVLDAHPDGIIYRDLIPNYVKFVRTIYEDDLGTSTVDVNYFNVGGAGEPDYQLFIC